MINRRLLAPGLWLLAVLICLWLSLFRTPVSTDISLFLPKTDEAARLLHELREGPASRLLMIGLAGGSTAARAETSRRLAEALRETELFVRVTNGAASLGLEERQWLFAHRYILSPAVTPTHFTPEELHAALEQRLRELSSPLSSLREALLPQDPTGELLALLRSWEIGSQPRRRDGVWFSEDGKWALLLAETRASGYNLEAQAKAIGIIRANFANARTEPDIELLISGPGVLATQSQDTIRFEAQLLSAAASTLVLLLLFLIYRSWRPVLLSILPLASAILAGIAMTGLVFGGIYGITLAFGVTLLGVAIDYPIHLFSHLDSQTTVTDSLGRIWPTLRLGVITTAIGYTAMISADFTGLAQLGLFAITGLLAAAAVTRWVLPAFLPLVWMPRHDTGSTGWMMLLLHPGRYPALGLIVLGAIALASLALTRPPLWEKDIAALSPIPQAALALDRALRTALGAPEAGRLMVITAPDAETALQRSETLAVQLEQQIKQGTLSGFDMAARYLPSRATQRKRLAWLPDRKRLQQNLAAALVDLPYKPGLFEPFLDAVAKTRISAPLGMADMTGTILELRIASLLFPSHGRWIALLPLAGVQDDEALGQLARQSGEAVRYLNMRLETNRLMADFRDAALVRLAWGGIFLMLILRLGLGCWRRTLAVILPIGWALVMTITLLLLLGERLSLFHLVSLLLVLGIGIDYSLFFSRADDQLAMRRRTLRAVLVCSGSTLAVFGMLSFSTLPVLNAIGQTVAIGVFASFLAALVLAQWMTNPYPKQL